MADQKVAEEEKSGCALNFFDLFALVTGSVGFIVDTIALIGLLLAVVNFNGSQQINEAALPTIPGIVGLFLVLLYSWFAVSWYAVRRDYRHILEANALIAKDKLLRRWSDRIPNVVAALGALSLPLWLMWAFFVGLTTSSTFAEDLPAYLAGILIVGIIGFGLVGLVVAFIMSAIIGVLMPVVYSDMAIIDEEDIESEYDF